MEREATAELLAALAYGERSAAQRAQDNIRFAPDSRRAEAQRGIAAREGRNGHLIEARLAELGAAELTPRFAPLFDAFFHHTQPSGRVGAPGYPHLGEAAGAGLA